MESGDALSADASTRTRSTRTQYDLAEKKDILSTIEENGWTIGVAAQKLNKPRSTVRYWVETHDAITSATPGPRKKRLGNTGKFSSTHSYEKDIVSYVYEQEEAGTKVSRIDIYDFCSARDPDFRGKTKSAKDNWMLRFLKRHDLRPHVAPFSDRALKVSGPGLTSEIDQDPPASSPSILVKPQIAPDYLSPSDEEDDVEVVGVTPGPTSPDTIWRAAPPAYMSTNGFDLLLFKSDCKSLSPETWVDANVINYFIHTRIPKSSVCFTFYVEFYGVLFSENKQNRGGKQKVYESVRFFTSGFPYDKFRYLLIPVHQNYHYSLVVVDNPVQQFPGPTKLIGIDSLVGTHQMFEVFDLLIDFFARDTVNKTGKKFSRSRIKRSVAPSKPQQRGNHECGLYLMHFMQKISKFLDDSGPVDLAKCILPVVNLVDRLDEQRELHNIRQELLSELNALGDQ